MRPELQHIVDEAARVLGADITLEDKDFNMIAYGSQRFDVDSVRRNSILQRHSTRPVREWFEQFGISSSSTPLRTPTDEERGIRARICFPALWHGVTYGYLWALDESTPLQDPAVARGPSTRRPISPSCPDSTTMRPIWSRTSSPPTSTEFGRQ
jgi:hypothetical protein